MLKLIGLSTDKIIRKSFPNYFYHSYLYLFVFPNFQQSKSIICERQKFFFGRQVSLFFSNKGDLGSNIQLDKDNELLQDDQKIADELNTCFNPLMPGGKKKVTHTLTNLQLSASGLFKQV